MGDAVLYLVATPIGNLEDMTFRAVNILKTVDKIYAEDTRNSYVLLNHYGISTKVESYHEFNQDLKTKDILLELKSGMNIAIITDAGLPVISDPGYKIVEAAIKEEIAVSTIPGASAGISALIASGLPPKPHTFIGFLNAKSSLRQAELKELMYLKSTLIFYEAPHRIQETLKDMVVVLGNRVACIARELTKLYEEFIRGTLTELLELDSLKGEIVLLVEGYQESIEVRDYNECIDELIQLGSKPNDAVKEVAKMYNQNRQELYRSYVEYKNKK